MHKEGSDLVQRAKEFAREAHEGQTISNMAREPYFKHLQEVAQLVEHSGGTPIDIAAAWLHDVVEDTPATMTEIRLHFGEEVAWLVHDLTDAPELEHLPTPIRKERQATRLERKKRNAKRVKLADQTSNMQRIATDPPADWSTQKCREYISGACMIALVCRGVSAYLDETFRQAYDTACAVYWPQNS